MSDEPPVRSRSRLSASDVARRSFTTVRRGLDPEEVRDYLETVAEELAAAEIREEDLERELAAAEDRALHPDLDEATLTAALGQRSAAVLRNAHQEAARITQDAEASAAALLRDAHQQATDVHVRAEATAAERIAEAEIAANAFQQQARAEAAAVVEASRGEGERIVDHAREQGRTMLDQAQEARRRVLADMAERRRLMTAQIDQFRAARDELAAAVLGVRRSVEGIVDDLGRADDAARSAAAQAAHRRPVEATETVLVVEAERAAAEIGAPTGSPGDLEAAAVVAPLSIDDIRTVVPPGGWEVDETEDEPGDVDGPLVTSEPDLPSGGSAAEPWPGVEHEPAPTDPGRPAATGPASLVFDDLDGGGDGSPADTTGRGEEVAADGRGDEDAHAGRGEEDAHAGGRGEEVLGRALDNGDALAGVFEGENFGGDVFAGGQFGAAPGGDVGSPSSGDGASPVDAGPSGPGTGVGAVGDEPDEDVVEGLFARLRASREAAEQAGRADQAEDPAVGADSDAGAIGRGGDRGPDPGGAGTRRAGTRSAAGTAEAPAATAVVAPEATVTDVAAGPVGTPTIDQALARRTELLGPIGAVLARRLKRALQDDQNRLLERLRSGSGAWSADLLPHEHDQLALYAGAARPQVNEAMAAGIAFARSTAARSRSKVPAPDDAAVDTIADELGATVVRMLRRRLSGEGLDEPVERVGAAYREWRGERIERLVGDCAVEAFSAGVLAGVPAGTGIRWVRNEASLGCADCEDNALGGTVGVGEEFPTGHRHPPAHVGCRCLVLPTPA